MGSFAIAAGWVQISAGFLPRWLGCLAVVGGVGLVLARAVRLTGFWYLPYGLFWLWVVIVPVLLLRRAASVSEELAR